MRGTRRSTNKDVALVSDLTNGGAAIACGRLHKALVDFGCNATWLALTGEHGYGAHVVNDWVPLRVMFLQRLILRCVSSGRWGGTTAIFNNSIMAERLPKERYGIINLHNLHEGMSFRLLNRLPNAVPLLWTLHDMWPLTGYCCYSYDCNKYEDGCVGECPQANLWGQMTTTPSQEWQLRQSLFLRNAARLSFISPSKWLAECAQARLPAGVSVEVISNGIDLDVFKPLGDKYAVRQILGLPMQGKIILCGAQNISDPRKGTCYLINAVKRLNEKRPEPVTVIVFGHKPINTSLTSSWVHTGTIRDEALLNLYYNASDVFVLPSLADNLPNTLIEATAAGTPCVTFGVGGCSEVVRNNETGFVARTGDEEHLSECIEHLLDMDGDRVREMTIACRKVALREYSVQLQAQRYVSLIDRVRNRDTPLSDASPSAAESSCKPASISCTKTLLD